MGKVRLTYKHQRIVEDLLRSRMVAVSEGMCKYRDKHTDHSVAAEARMKDVDGCNNRHVAHVRKQMFGQLHRTPEPSAPNMRITSDDPTVVHLQDQISVLRRDLMLVLDFLTRTQGVDWTLEEFTRRAREEKLARDQAEREKATHV